MAGVRGNNPKGSPRARTGDVEIGGSGLSPLEPSSLCDSHSASYLYGCIMGVENRITKSFFSHDAHSSTRSMRCMPYGQGAQAVRQMLFQRGSWFKAIHCPLLLKRFRAWPTRSACAASSPVTVMDQILQRCATNLYESDGDSNGGALCLNLAAFDIFADALQNLPSFRRGLVQSSDRIRES
ncbi:hypothetical protein VNO77_15090 [Canavalia gladiata]|uniref:Uncharacterized protein n=1 Tax=Canavalia gladiata TaxID=3824 RepID=A0AAN9QP08_CANGL